MCVHIILVLGCVVYSVFVSGQLLRAPSTFTSTSSQWVGP